MKKGEENLALNFAVLPAADAFTPSVPEPA